ncbi:hypothetical protein GCM10019016_103470 [Streptomyces prasinosporus]|uniref:Uncharacterized protein n=1 Tax=Streptomyces prasinosporus TaxID=68256 RepID=A0ABP6U6P9_9ACTN
MAGPVEEIGPSWQERHQAGLAPRPRKRVVARLHDLSLTGQAPAAREEIPAAAYAGGGPW